MARVDIEVDSPKPTPVPRSVDTQESAERVKIHAPRDLQVSSVLPSAISVLHSH